ncbi:MAG: glycoside hydrolase family 3 N-terminal domain-containing protein [Candidatus Gastranaerophilales bacterium]|nr:glycoside hydrolase family 3 N-terminal domain-containing protein [Candidatus Gastranaerophilales bacterium]
MKTLREQINSIFILGYKGVIPPENLKELVLDGLGGVIFFAENIKERNAFKNTVADLKAFQPELITSIDQEGGRVERTKNLPDAIKYIPPLEIIKLPENLIEKHYEVLAQELCDFGINMNFAPVLDIHTNADNPVINNRAFGTTADEVIKYSQIVQHILHKYSIFAVGKHFCGHGGSSVDSHLALPVIDMPMEELQEHIRPFAFAVNDGIDAIMVAHVHFTAFDEETLPASLSKNVISYLKKDLGFSGLVISDDMVMGGVTSFGDPLDVCIRGIKAGIDMFIFRDMTPEVLQLLSDLENAAQDDLELYARIEEASSEITDFKKNIKTKQVHFDPVLAQKEIEQIKSSLK